MRSAFCEVHRSVFHEILPTAEIDHTRTMTGINAGVDALCLCRTFLIILAGNERSAHAAEGFAACESMKDSVKAYLKAFDCVSVLDNT